MDIRVTARAGLGKMEMITGKNDLTILPPHHILLHARTRMRHMNACFTVVRNTFGMSNAIR